MFRVVKMYDIRVRYVLEEYNGSWASFSNCSSQTNITVILSFIGIRYKTWIRLY